MEEIQRNHINAKSKGLHSFFKPFLEVLHYSGRTKAAKSAIKIVEALTFLLQGIKTSKVAKRDEQKWRKP
jgi:hypothetical protein